MRLKKECRQCEETFFSENPKSLFCPKCEKERIQIQKSRKQFIKRKPFKKKQTTQKTDHNQPPSVPKSIISNQIRERIIDKYKKFVERMERPEKGRRKAIAKMHLVSKKDVFMIIREWNKNIPNTDTLNRQEKFTIEKRYFVFVDEGVSLDKIPEFIADETGYTQWQVARYLDTIHEMRKPLYSIKLPEKGSIDQIIGIYLDILNGETHPEQPLHDHISQMVGVTPKEVYRVLVNYRLRLRGSLIKSLMENE